ncbi:hypothetical protein H5410_005337 [Solanum commersonii]|uniref:Uncharacterized protein n=1 Tax=Solanum commersonii TaxID=4109 RepID=A0A9J6A7X6_SOLCO|nr:hypothetical protein H5410_005337 [Solanum commersonii]
MNLKLNESKTENLREEVALRSGGNGRDNGTEGDGEGEATLVSRRRWQLMGGSACGALSEPVKAERRRKRGRDKEKKRWFSFGKKERVLR